MCRRGAWVQRQATARIARDAPGALHSTGRAALAKLPRGIRLTNPPSPGTGVLHIEVIGPENMEQLIVFRGRRHEVNAHITFQSNTNIKLREHLNRENCPEVNCLQSLVKFVNRIDNIRASTNNLSFSDDSPSRRVSSEFPFAIERIHSFWLRVGQHCSESQAKTSSSTDSLSATGLTKQRRKGTLCRWINSHPIPHNSFQPTGNVSSSCELERQRGAQSTKVSQRRSR